VLEDERTCETQRSGIVDDDTAKYVERGDQSGVMENIVRRTREY